MAFRRELSTNLIGTGLTFGLGMANQAVLARGLDALHAAERVELSLYVDLSKRLNRRLGDRSPPASASRTAGT